MFAPSLQDSLATVSTGVVRWCGTPQFPRDRAILMSEAVSPANASATQEAEIAAALGARSVVLVGMMGAGKSIIGRRLSARLGMPFLDADAEIEQAHRLPIPDIFAE